MSHTPTETVISADRVEPDVHGAVAELVERNLPLVYRAALRQTRDPGMAEEVTQAVFLLVCQRADRLKGHACLGGWLFTTTRNVARTHMRTERRRRARELRAARQEAVAAGQQAGGEWEEMSGHLDAGIARLGKVDRELVILRYLQGVAMSEAAARFGLTEAAARKRVTRAFEKLRGYFADRGVVMSADALGVALVAEAARGIPAGLARTVLSPAAGAKALAAGTAKAMAVRAVMTKVMAPVAAAGVVIGGVAYLFGGSSAKVPAAVVVTPSLPVDLRPVVVADPKLAGYPIAKGWPVALPGSVIGAPVVADLEGDGRLCVVVPVIDRYSEVMLSHPSRHTTGYLYAMRADGTVPPGWPVQIAGVAPPQQGNGGRGGWSASPSVFQDGRRDALLMQTWPATRAFVVRADGQATAVGGGDATVSIPLVDLDGDGVLDYVTGRVVANVRGGQVAGWPGSRLTRNGYVPCAGDADGDGRPELYHLYYTAPETGAVEVCGFDRTGKVLPGWPRFAEDSSWFPPAMGDIDGDGRMEVVAAYGEHLYAWTWDGRDLPCDFVDGGHKGVFKKDVVACTATPALADLDGDGKAEVIVYDEKSGSIRAWHGDGRPVVGTDGVIARLPGPCHGVSVADLGADGVMDLFAGTWWVRFDPRSGKPAEVTAMVPGAPTIEWTQPTICDVDGDGKADVVFGLTDGRVVVYNTGLAYRPELVQWATTQGNFRHTSCWEGPKGSGRR